MPLVRRPQQADEPTNPPDPQLQAEPAQVAYQSKQPTRAVPSQQSDQLAPSQEPQPSPSPQPGLPAAEPHVTPPAHPQRVPPQPSLDSLVSEAVMTDTDHKTAQALALQNRCGHAYLPMWLRARQSTRIAKASCATKSSPSQPSRDKHSRSYTHPGRAQGAGAKAPIQGSEEASPRSQGLLDASRKQRPRGPP